MTAPFGYDKAEILAYLERLRKFNEWEEANPQLFTPEQALDAVSDMYQFIPVDARGKNDGPTYEGARFMMSCLAKLK